MALTEGVSNPAEMPDAPPVEFLPWYKPTANFTRCSVCGSVVMSDDQEQHVKFHENLRAFGKSVAFMAYELARVVE